MAALLPTVIWGGFALGYQMPFPTPARAIVIAAWCLLGGAACLATALPRMRGWRRNVLPVFGVALVILLGWWSTLTPSHNRDWADDVAHLLDVEVDTDRDQVTLHNVRNFEWRSEADYAPRWETRTYDLDQLVSADLVLSYWMGPAIAHTLVSFGFADGERVVFSLEIRKERHESFSALGGLFRRFERILVAADERDIIRTRSNARGEDVYLYRLAKQPDAVRGLFLGYADEARQLRREPAFYNTLTSNCTTIVFELARRIAPGIPMDHRLLLSGYFAQYVYDLGGLTPGYEFAQLQSRGHINPRALSIPVDTVDHAAFSGAIRRGVPGIQPHEVAP